MERVREIVPGIHTWSLFSNERGTAFNGFAVETSDGTVLVDPVDPAEEEWSSLDDLAPYVGVYVTNRNHSRAAAEFRSRYGTPSFTGRMPNRRRSRPTKRLTEVRRSPGRSNWSACPGSRPVSSPSSCPASER